MSSIMDEGLNRPGTDADITDNTCNHQCSKCGHCCTCWLPLTVKEVNVIKDYLKVHPVEPNFLSDFDEHNQYAFCPFLDKDTRACRIYPVRPLICRLFKCDQSIETINKNRLLVHKRADYNSCGLSKHDKGMASTQMIFFNDYVFDIRYRHLVCCGYGKELSLEQEQAIMPLIADKYISRKEEK